MHKKILQKQNKSRTKAEQTENRGTVTTTRGEKGATLTTTRDFLGYPYYYTRFLPPPLLLHIDTTLTTTRKICLPLLLHMFIFGYDS